MNKLISSVFAIGLLTFNLVTSAEPDGLEALVGTEIPRFECRTYGSWGTLAEEGIAKLLQVRDRANKHCLSCRGPQCLMKQWPDKQSEGRRLCESLYCIPKSFPRAVTSEQSGWAAHVAEVHFKVDQEGRGKLQEYVALTEADRIKPYKREIERTTRGFLHSTRFEPLVVDGEAKEIVNLVYVIRIENRD